MEREIKFRGKMTHTEEWIYGNLIGKDVIVGSITDWDEDFFATEFWHKVNSESIGQFTGHKDKIGADIFEHDLVRDDDGDISEIEWNQNQTAFWIKPLKFSTLEDITAFPSQLGNGYLKRRDLEVIGNIHENLELLK